MGDESTDTEADDAPSPNQQWAFIFNEFGKQRLRQFLFHAATSLAEDGDDQAKLVYELQQSDAGLTAMNITDHVQALETDTPDLPNTQ
jgi:hypothetical protein